MNIYIAIALLFLTVAVQAAPVRALAQEPAREPVQEKTRTGGPSMSEQPGIMPPLTPVEEAIIVHKGTERPYSGRYVNNKADGIYVCRACGASLFAAGDKFDSRSGWPSFDDAVPGAVKQVPDKDGLRTEIVCVNCGAHLGHVFKGEGFTPKNVRHCVNSISMSFVPKGEPLPVVSGIRVAPQEEKTAEPAVPKSVGLSTAVFAGGCFWGVEHIFAKTPGVADAQSGYSGGTVPNPSYEQVCSGRTGHAEAVRVTYDPAVISYEQLARLFFELHDPTQLNRQGPDVGSQYRSVLFYNNDEEQQIADKLVRLLWDKGYDVVTEIVPAAPFYPAEAYHQDYIAKHPGWGCHLPEKRFD